MSSRPIQTQPRGLLGFLQLKNMGQNPAVLPETLQSVLELREWLWETNAESVPSTINGVAFIPAATAVGNYVVLAVPNDEAWALLDCTCTPVTGVGQAITFRLIYLDMNAPQGTAYGISDYLAKGASDISALAMPRSFRIPIIPPGGRLGIQITAITAAAADFAGSFVARVARLRS